MVSDRFIEVAIAQNDVLNVCRRLVGFDVRLRQGDDKQFLTFPLDHRYGADRIPSRPALSFWFITTPLGCKNSIHVLLKAGAVAIEVLHYALTVHALTADSFI